MDRRAEIHLSPYGGSSAESKILTLDARKSSFSLVISNEPDSFDYCAQNTQSQLRPLTHFSHFYSLSKGGPGHGEDHNLPLPYTSITGRQCSQTLKKLDSGRRVNCMMAQYEGFED
jgi:hypothetical protein